MNIVKITGSVLIISFGAFMFVYGEMDDSPGGQLLGFVLAIIGVVGVIRIVRKIRKSS